MTTTTRTATTHATTAGILAAPAPAPKGHLRIAHRNRSVLLHRRTVVCVIGMLAVLAFVTAVSLSFGKASVNLVDALPAAFGWGEARDVLLVQTLRLPRVEAGLVTGSALGVAGCLMQTLARNRLATPDTVGLNNGATAFAVASVVAVPASLAPSGAALAGAATAVAITLGLAGGAGQRGYRFLVTGLGVGAVFGAVTNLMLSRAAIDAANAAFPWTVGSLNTRSPVAVDLLEIALLVAVPTALLLGRDLSVLRFADAVATGLGKRVRRVRIGTLAVAVVCAGLSVAVAGPVGMIALAAPEAARKLVGPGPVPVIASGLAGSIMLLLADLIGRTIAAPLELPVGLVTAVVGGPYLLWLLLTTRSGRLR